MKKKAQALFNQRLLTQLSKFKEISTIASGHLQIKSLLAESDIEEAQGVFTVLEADTSSSDRAKKEFVKIYASMIEIYGMEMLNYFQKLLHVLGKKTAYPNEAAEVFAALTRLIVSLDDEEEQLERLYMIQRAFEGCSKQVFVGTCLRCIIKELPASILVRMESQLCAMLGEKISCSKVKVQLIEALLSLLLALEENFEEDDLVRVLVEGDIKNEDWNVRKGLIDLFYGLLVLKGPTEKDSKVIDLIKEAKYDKIKTVRDAAINCLSIFKNEVSETKTTPKKQAPKPWKIQPVVQAPPQPRQKSKQLSKTQVITTTSENIKPKNPPKNAKIQRNESFFKKATLQNEIVVTNLPEPSSIQYADLPFDPLSITNIEKRGFNDTIEQIQSMMPKGLSIAESMVFKNDESRDLEEEKKLEEESMGEENHDRGGEESNQRFERIEGQIRSIHNFMIGFERTIVEKLAQIEIRVEKIERQRKEDLEREREKERDRERERQGNIEREREREVELERERLRLKFKQKVDSSAQHDPHLLIVQHPSPTPSSPYSPMPPSLNVSKQYPVTLNIQPYINSNQQTISQIKNFSQEITLGNPNIRQKALMHLNQQNVQTCYQIIFTEGNDNDILWLIQETDMTVNQLSDLHLDFLVYKIREFISKGIELQFCLKWLEKYFRNGRLSSNVDWGKFLRKIRCNSQEEQRIKKSIVDLEARTRI